MRIWVSGSLAYDIILDYQGKFADHIRPEKLHVISLSFLVRSVNKTIGGTAGNIAYSLAMLGMKPCLLAAVGEDGKEMLGRYGKLGISVKNIRISRLPTAAAYIMTDSMDNQITGFHPGAMNEKIKLPKLKKNDWAIIAAENPRNMAALARHYQKNQIRYIFDPGQAITSLSKSQMRQCVSGAAIVIGNDYEIDNIFGKIKSPLPSPPPPDFAKATTGTRGEGNKNEFLPLEGGGKVGVVIIRTLGPKGSEIVCPNGKKIKIGVAQVKKSVDPTGAGDAYRAGLICGIMRGFDLKIAAQLGATSAAFAVEHYGTQNHHFNYGILVKRHNKNFESRI
ncbi:MAG: hypothetical protein A2751_00280 [Candidatus Doudnabacteria bacterium RIFCSPHIGHO2_01_FULL_46_14]|uniref:Carbohydrate kinase PfkB domain-containing protein n=1 Tax=Candidatus Doudnabacteria bacterium RIFCSPHIGHO2_01_FULL_46_14 TaxID=1817824 RepID=A0A1F5NQ92_9BACT|nr:MAG: hypothetical protein A2751_00280 [Candidatus Doudnabacteria bacterium RIFCSPHIGHO2_01_FULL_46_14]